MLFTLLLLSHTGRRPEIYELLCCVLYINLIISFTDIPFRHGADDGKRFFHLLATLGNLEMCWGTPVPCDLYNVLTT
jgi:hypothetical protein